MHPTTKTLLLLFHLVDNQERVEVQLLYNSYPILKKKYKWKRESEEVEANENDIVFKLYL